VETTSPSPLLRRSPTLLRPRGFEFWWSLLFLISATVSGFCFSVAVAIFAMLAGLDVRRQPPALTVQMLLNSAVLIGVGLFVVAFVPLLARRPLRDLGIRTFGWREIGIGLFGALAMTIVVDGLAALMTSITHYHATEAAIELLKEVHTPTEATLFILMAAGVAPLVEELAFRVFLFNAFARYAPVSIAALLSGVLFGLAHLQSLAQLRSPDYLLTVSLPLAGGGIVLACVYAWSRCYWSNVITHALFNAFPLVLYFDFHVKT
jgi:membrane protease YdiL (CAAX protease family)